MIYLASITSFVVGVVVALAVSRIFRPLTGSVTFASYNCATKTATFTGVIGEPAPRRIWAKVVAGATASVPGFPAPYGGDPGIGSADVAGGNATISQPAGANWPGSGAYTIIFWEDFGENGATQSGNCSGGGSGGGSGSGGGGGSSGGGGGGSSGGGGGGASSAGGGGGR